MPSVIGIIGGSGFYSLGDKTESIESKVTTPYSDKPVSLYTEQVEQKQVLFLPRHGIQHDIPPHKVNYRANLWALNQSGVDKIIAVNVVGGITDSMTPGTMVIPDQLIDYTWGREHSYFDELGDADNHVDFSWPYDNDLRQILAGCGIAIHDNVISSGVYGCTQGPRLETAAEIRRMQRDGCDIVGMTGMPEAALARELKISYASIALVVNWAAGITDEEISFAEISATLDTGVAELKQVVLATISALS